ncbi:MAG: trigger factor [Acidimicrobiia bacterium]
MKSTVEPLEGNKVKVSVQVDEAEFDKAIDAAFRKIAHEVRIDGFRPGKAPRRILEARIGIDYARSQALQDSIPEFLAAAVRENDVDIIAPPSVEITEGQESGPVSFAAEIEVRPVITVPGYGGLRVEVPSPYAVEADVDAQLERMRQPFAELNDVDRPVAGGDYVTIDLVGSRDDEPLPGLEVTDYLYAVGSGQVVPELDDQLVGASADDVIEFTAAHPVEGEDDIDFRVTVKGVKERILPEVTDEWAKEASEFDTVEALRADIVRRLSLVKAMQAQMSLREKAAEALASLVDEEPPEALVNDETRRRVEDLVMRLQAQGLSVEQYLAMQGTDVQTFSEGLKATAATGVKVDLALRAVAAAEQLTVDDDDLDAEFERMAAGSKQKPSQIRKAYERNDAISALVADMRKRKAMEWIVEHCEIVDPDGNVIDRAALNPSAADDDSDSEESGE